MLLLSLDVSFLPRIQYGINSSRNPDLPLQTQGTIKKKLDSRLHGNDRIGGVKMGI
jgi:hypothetical protein